MVLAGKIFLVERDADLKVYHETLIYAPTIPKAKDGERSIFVVHNPNSESH
jgi:hypothetical protein